MLRVNLFLIFLVVVCALAVVTSNHRARKLTMELERTQERMRALEVEWGQLQLEQSTWATHARIEESARKALRMHAPDPKHTISLEP
ncbi:MAG: cell division protein FtsL [Rhodocyclaceae bacterium]|nr:cell division protein FtsL [Rhodocyclaceae bacterium]